MALQVVVSPLLGVLFDNLDSLIRNEVGLLWGVDKEMKKLIRTLSAIRDVLGDAEEKQITEKVVANWLLELRDLAYDADDLLDEWETEASELKLGTEDIACSKQVCISYFSCFNFAQLVFRRKIARRVNDLREKFDEINKERSSFSLSVGFVPRRPQHHGNRETSSLLTVPHVYGRDEEKEFIVRQILDNVRSEADLSVHPIVGIGGLGKTTLAQVCYNDPRVEEHFDVRVWVCVSVDFDVKRLTKTVLVSVREDVHNIEDLDPLQRLLQKKLGQKRFLLVLDDVWNENQEEWGKFANSLRCGALGSSIIVTTRLEKVASIIGTHAPLHLKLLSEDDCWSLFSQCAFGMGNNESQNLVKIGQEIVKKCGRLPLAAKVLGGLLRFEKNENQWLYVRDSNIWELSDNTILPALRLSYTHLAPYARQCFAYCAMFPKDYRMKKDQLIRLWMANGLIQSRGEMQMEDVGDWIFNELSLRLFFQDEEKNSFGFVVSCKMHDLIHDLACSINMKECYNLDKGAQMRDVHLKTRHLSINCRGESYNAIIDSLHQSAPNLRTLMFLRIMRTEPIHEVCLKPLRALSLKCKPSMELLNSLGNLKHLRYLNISLFGVEVLPNSLCKLKNIQTVELVDCANLKKLPEYMGNMSSLRHLQIKGPHELREMPPRMGKLVRLQTLSLFIVGADEGRNIKELQELDYLGGEVKIMGLEHVKTREEAKEANLKRKHNMVILEFVWGLDREDNDDDRDVLEGLQPHPNLKRLGINGYRGRTFPSWFDSDVSSSLPYLVKIKIKNCSNLDHLPSSLGGLPLLRHLVIRNVRSVKFFWANNSDDVANAFPSLEELQIDEMNELEDWFPSGRTGVNSNSDHFPSLKKLEIYNCPKLKRFPPYLLSSLQKLVLKNCKELEDWFPGGRTGVNSNFDHFPSLKKLEIYNCSKLKRLPPYPLSSLQKLVLQKCRELEIGRCPTSLQKLELCNCNPMILGSLKNLPTLSSLHISSFKDITCFPEESLQNLPFLECLDIRECDRLQSLPSLMGITSLTDLYIVSCPSLTNVPLALRHQTSLLSLEIRFCPKAEISVVEYQHLSSLQGLSIEGFDEMTVLPDGMQHLSSTLQWLKIYECSALNSLPDWIGSFTNLKILWLVDCKNLTSLPDGIQQLTNLQTLWINTCHPELHRRCERETGEDWPKIRHIPRLRNAPDGTFVSFLLGTLF